MRARLMVVVILLFGCGAAHAGLVVNGGFETGNFTGWTVTGPNLLNTNYGISTNTPEEGLYCAWFSGSATGLTFLSQTLATVPGQVEGVLDRRHCCRDRVLRRLFLRHRARLVTHRYGVAIGGRAARRSSAVDAIGLASQD